MRSDPAPKSTIERVEAFIAPRAAPTDRRRLVGKPRGRGRGCARERGRPALAARILRAAEHAARGLVLLLAAASTATAQPPRLSLILSDSYSEPAARAVQDLYATDATLREHVRLHVFPSTSGALIDRVALRASRVVVFNVHRLELVEEMRPDLEALVEAGNVVYAVGGTPMEDELKRMGLRFDATVLRYYDEGGPTNLRNLVVFLLQRHLDLAMEAAPPEAMPERGILDVRTGRTYDEFAAYRAAYRAHHQDRPWVGVTLLRNYVVSGQTRHIEGVVDALERRGFNVLPVFGFPEPENLERHFLDEAGRPRVEAVVGMSLRLGVDPDALGTVLERIGAPVVNAISLSRQSAVEWRDDPVGIDITERTWQVANPELGGLIAPTVVASKEPVADPELGLEYLEYRPIPERVERLADRIAALVRLRSTPNADKRVAVVYYNYPPGRENVGASYLNVLPKSLTEILDALAGAGYALGGRDRGADTVFARVMERGRNAGPWAGGDLRGILEAGEAVRIPVSKYRAWFDELPASFRATVERHWGPPENARIMATTGADGEKELVLPVLRWGNVLLAAQPLRAEPHDPAHAQHHDPTHAYHDLALPPHHQYIAFHLWLRNEWDAHAMLQVGTHGTHEWLPGKDVGFAEDDAPEILLADLPNVYLYIVDDVGEGLQAKRRGMATVVDHMTPPFERAGLEGGLERILALIDEYNVASSRSPTVAAVRRDEINAALVERGLLTDLGLEQVETAQQMEHVEHHLRAIAQSNVPYGLHVFGRSPAPERIRSTAEAIASLDPAMTDAARSARVADLEARLAESGPRERASMLAALEGRYIAAGPGNDPLRNPDALPTGKNFYAFNPGRIPSPAIFETGATLADTLVSDYRERHGRWPERLTFNVWSTETIRHEGIVESQIMHLLGMRPVWDPRGMVSGVEPIPRDELGRPRIDVTIIPSGLYRDLFPNLMRLMDQAVTVAIAQDEADNHARLEMLEARQRLEADGIDTDLAERLASLRIFSVPPGTYGTGLEDIIEASDAWDEEAQVANVFFNRMSHAYGQGFWGERPEDEVDALAGRRGLSVDLLKGALSGSRIAVHSRSSNVYATLDNDDFYQYLGGTALAIRSVDGESPEIYVSNLTNPADARQETLARFMGRELRARYLNPTWIEGMMAEGYSGARFMSRVVSHLWGWQVTVPDVVDEAKWNEMYATYVEDRNDLGLKEWFSQTEHAWAYQTIVARLLETTRRGYWEAPPEVVAHLAAELSRSVADAGAACNALVCNNTALLEFAMAQLEAIPGAPAPSVLAEAIAAARGEAPPLVADAAAAEAAVDESIDPPPDAVPAAEALAGTEAMVPAPDDGIVHGFEMVEAGIAQPVAVHGRAVRVFQVGFVLMLMAVVLGWGWHASFRRPAISSLGLAQE